MIRRWGQSMWRDEILSVTLLNEIMRDGGTDIRRDTAVGLDVVIVLYPISGV